LFLIGLLTGLAEQHFTNVRMALAAHLEGVMNGILLLTVGAIWNEVRLSSLLIKITYWALLGGTYGNWVVTTTAAILGTAALSPITAGGAQCRAGPRSSRHHGICLDRTCHHLGILTAFVGFAGQREGSSVMRRENGRLVLSGWSFASL
jgi:hypothetical protein